MTNYYLHLHECGKVVRANEPLDLPSLEAARNAAIKGARDIMCSELAAGRLCLSCHIEIEDEKGAIVLTVPFADAVTVTGIN